jgi:hypothetical protein
MVRNFIQRTFINLLKGGAMSLLCNRDISQGYQGCAFWLYRSDIIAAFAYWIVKQSPYEVPYITRVLQELDRYVKDQFPGKNEVPVRCTYQELHQKILRGGWSNLPCMCKLSTPKRVSEDPIIFISEGTNLDPAEDFIDLYALAKNVFYAIMREEITTGSIEGEVLPIDTISEIPGDSQETEEEEWEGSGFLSNSSGPI